MGEQKEFYSDEEILLGILNHDRQKLTELYRRMYPLVQKILEAEGADEADAWDVFQEALSAIYMRLLSSSNTLKLKSSFTTFFSSICKHVWYKQLRRKQMDARYMMEVKNHLKSDLDSMDEQIKTSIMLRLMWRNIQKLKPKCRILMLSLINGVSFAEMVDLHAYGSLQVVYNKRRSCIEKLFNLIKKDPDYFILKEYEKP